MDGGNLFSCQGGGNSAVYNSHDFAAHKTLSVAGALLAGLFSLPAPPSNKLKLLRVFPPTTLCPARRPCFTTGKPIPPRNAPSQVKRAIAAANSLVNKPYRLGGGHRRHHDTHYDCSGSTSFVLKEAGLLTSTRHSRLFLNYGQKGAGTGFPFMPRMDTSSWSSAASGLTLREAGAAAKAPAGEWTAAIPGTSWCAIPQAFEPGQRGGKPRFLRMFAQAFLIMESNVLSGARTLIVP